MNQPRFTFGRSIGDDLLDAADTMQIRVHRVGASLGLTFELRGGIGKITDEDDPQQARQVKDFAESLLGAFKPRPASDDDGCCDCY